MSVFADSEDLAKRWRTLSSVERGRADVLLEDASQLILDLDPHIQDRVSDVTLRSVVCSMVKRAMQGPAALDGVVQSQQTAGPFQQGVTFANPSGDLYLTKLEKRRLGIGVQRAFSVDLLAEDDAES